MKRSAPLPPSSAPVSDVSLLLEGTYPYVRGGVSSWVHQIISGLPELRFSLVFVGGRRQDYGDIRYELPANVVGMHTYYLEDALRGLKPPRHIRKTHPRLTERVHCFHRQLRTSHHPEAPTDALTEMLKSIATRGDLQVDDFMFGDAAYDFIRDMHLKEHAASPFVDYFWTLRLLHGPVFQLARIADDLPPTRLFHAVSTGYAGLLGALLRHRRGTPLVLTEHGIYTKERRIDLNKAEWIEAIGKLRDQASDEGDPSAAIRTLWVRYFESLGKLTYQAADPIISLYEGNRRYQVADGAPEERTKVIVNGIDVERFAPALEQRPKEPPKVIGLIGRVVPIKDIKTFIRAMHHVTAKRPDIEGWIIGGEDEDPGYAEECHAMVENLHLGERVRFLGHQNVAEILPKLGALMLTSISEAQPLSILEAFAAGVPCITTDVGACREQIEGRAPEDKALGIAGRVVPFADAHGLAEAALWLLSDSEVYFRCAEAAVQRVHRYYAQPDMIAAYRDVYQNLMRA